MTDRPSEHQLVSRNLKHLVTVLVLPLMDFRGIARRIRDAIWEHVEDRAATPEDLPEHYRTVIREFGVDQIRNINAAWVQDYMEEFVLYANWTNYESAEQWGSAFVADVTERLNHR